MNLIQRAKTYLGMSPRPEAGLSGQFFGFGEFGNPYAIESLGDGWQRNLTVNTTAARHVPAVYACVMAIARAISQTYPRHVRVTDGKYEHIKNSAAYRVLKNPNEYQTTPDFLLNLVATALFDGEAYALATRNNRNEIESLHLLPRGNCHPVVDPDTQTVFYQIGSSELVPGSGNFVAPARDVLAIRFHTPRHPLIGESPIKSAALAIGINVALSQTQATFFANMNRPSGILSTDTVLTRDQMTQLRAAFEDQSKLWAKGGMPILSSGLKFQQMAVDSVDAQLIESQRMSIEDIARVFGVPSPLINDLSKATLNNAETLIQNFLSMSLGSYLEHIERSFDRLFGITGDDYIELDIAALLRTDFAGRVDGLTKAVQGGLMTPDEARAREGLSPIDGGDTAYLQRQMTPIDKIGDLLEAETKRADAAAKPPEPPKPSDNKPTGDNEPPPEPAKDIDVSVAKALIQNYMIQRAQKC